MPDEEEDAGDDDDKEAAADEDADLIVDLDLKAPSEDDQGTPSSSCHTPQLTRLLPLASLSDFLSMPSILRPMLRANTWDASRTSTRWPALCEHSNLGVSGSCTRRWTTRRHGVCVSCQVIRMVLRSTRSLNNGVLRNATRRACAGHADCLLQTTRRTIRCWRTRGLHYLSRRPVQTCGAGAETARRPSCGDMQGSCRVHRCWSAQLPVCIGRVIERA